MATFDDEIDAALESQDRIPRELVVGWIENARDLRTLAKLYVLTDKGYYRVQPELGGEATCALIESYLLACIRENVEGDEEILSRFDAAGTLHHWLRHVLTLNGRENVIRHTAQSVTELFLQSGEDIRNCIETAFLEHALETAALRPYFEHWASDPVLKSAWGRALAWGKAHPDYMAKMFDRLNKR